ATVGGGAIGHTGAMIRAGDIAAVVFDFDGLVVDTEWPSYVSWQALFAEHGAELSVEYFRVCIGTRNAVDWGELLAAKTGRAGPRARHRGLAQRRHRGQGCRHALPRGAEPPDCGERLLRGRPRRRLTRGVLARRRHRRPRQHERPRQHDRDGRLNDDRMTTDA